MQHRCLRLWLDHGEFKVPAVAGQPRGNEMIEMEVSCRILVDNQESLRMNGGRWKLGGHLSGRQSHS
jgi:hypothetical protein